MAEALKEVYIQRERLRSLINANSHDQSGPLSLPELRKEFRRVNVSIRTRKKRALRKGRKFVLRAAQQAENAILAHYAFIMAVHRLRRYHPIQRNRNAVALRAGRHIQRYPQRYRNYFGADFKAKHVAVTEPAFPMFQKLPAEVRVKIWEFVDPGCIPMGPRVVQVTCNPLSHPTARFCKSISPSILCKINLESSGVAMSTMNYSLINLPSTGRFGFHTPTRFYINFDRDVLELAVSQDQYRNAFQHTDFRTLLSAAVCDNIKFIRLTPSQQGKRRHWDGFTRHRDYFVQFRRSFPRLKELYINVGAAPTVMAIDLDSSATFSERRYSNNQALAQRRFVEAKARFSNWKLESIIFFVMGKQVLFGSKVDSPFIPKDLARVGFSGFWEMYVS